MNICNGVSLNSIELKKFRVRNQNYYDNLASLDIEVSTAFMVNGKLIEYDKENYHFFDDKKSYSLMYLWNICIDGYLFSGRSLDDLYDFLEQLNDKLDGTFYIYVHNLSYEFQFLVNKLTEIDVFARKKRKPIKFTWRNIEFRCSYMLTRLSLDTWAREKNLDVKKLTGMYNYTKIRTPLTYLTTLERDYGYNDVLVVVNGLEEYKERYKHVRDIPLTQTSCIRKVVNKVMKNEYKVKKNVAAMTDVSLEVYQFMIDCFLGGYTHANIIFSNRTIYNLLDFDISSSYPWAMLSEKYPVTPWRLTEKSFDYYLNNDRYCCMLEVELFDIDSIFFNTYISASKCIEKDNVIYDNGRIISADRVLIRVLDVDYEIIKKSYHIEKIVIRKLYYALNGYLPDNFRRYLIELFCHKTTLKGIDEQFTLYFKSKEELNGCFGMAVTKDITDEITFNNDWTKKNLTSEMYYEKVRKKTEKWYKLNMSYSQGIYVPAYGRKNLWYMVEKFDDLIVYMDTDSLKIAPPHDGIKEIISQYNEHVHKMQRKIADDLDIDYSRFNPFDSKGVSHSIGVYEEDDTIKAFRTLGAKRYICEYDESRGENWLKMTVSGVRKKAVQQLNTIEDFRDGLTFTIDNAQKMIMIYNDMQDSVTWQEGLYDEWHCEDQYGISGYNIPYRIGISSDYLLKIREVWENTTSLFRRK